MEMAVNNALRDDSMKGLIASVEGVIISVLAAVAMSRTAVNSGGMSKTANAGSKR